MSGVQRQDWELGDLGSIPGLCQSYSERPSARNLHSLCLWSLCEKALRSTYISVLQVLKLTHLWTPEHHWMQKSKEIGGMSWLCAAHTSQVPGSLLWVLAGAGGLFGSSKGEDILFSGDCAAFLSLGEAVPRAGSPMLRRKPVQPTLSSG